MNAPGKPNKIAAIRKEYPEVYAIYDLGSEYGICTQDIMVWANKETLEPRHMAMRYDTETMEAISNSIPLWQLEDDDNDI